MNGADCMLTQPAFFIFVNATRQIQNYLLFRKLFHPLNSFLFGNLGKVSCLLFLKS